MFWYMGSPLSVLKPRSCLVDSNGRKTAQVAAGALDSEVPCPTLLLMVRTVKHHCNTCQVVLVRAMLVPSQGFLDCSAANPVGSSSKDFFSMW